MNSGVYVIENNINGKWYIGSSVKLDTRFHLHLSSLKKNAHHSWKLQKDFNKYGESAFNYKILLYLDGEIIRIIERELIEYFETYKESGYNINRDTISRSGSIQSEETKKKISESLKRYKLENGHNKTGTKHSEDTKKKMSEAQKKRFEDPDEIRKISGKIISQETRKKISEKSKGRKMSENQKRLISKILTGKKRGPLSEEHKKKISETFKRKRTS